MYTIAKFVVKRFGKNLGPSHLIRHYRTLDSSVRTTNYMDIK